MITNRLLAIAVCAAMALAAAAQSDLAFAKNKNDTRQGITATTAGIRTAARFKQSNRISLRSIIA